MKRAIFKSMLLALCLVSSLSWSQEDETSIYVSDSLKSSLQQASQFTVAVMPMENVSVEPEVAFHFRQRAIELLVAKGYTVVGSEWIDQALYKLGLTHAGQLRLLSMEQLSEVVKADGYLFGIVEEARTQNAAVYNAYVYKSSLKMDAANSENLWFSLEQRVSKRRFAIDPINAILDVFLVDEGGDAKNAVGALADRLMEAMPQGPATVIIGDDLLSMATEVEVLPQSSDESLPEAEDVYQVASEESSTEPLESQVVTSEDAESLEEEKQAEPAASAVEPIADEVNEAPTKPVETDIKQQKIDKLELKIENLELKIENLELRLKQLEAASDKG